MSEPRGPIVLVIATAALALLALGGGARTWGIAGGCVLVMIAAFAVREWLQARDARGRRPR
jgi:hypothetical protein